MLLKRIIYVSCRCHEKTQSQMLLPYWRVNLNQFTDHLMKSYFIFPLLVERQLNKLALEWIFFYQKDQQWMFSLGKWIKCSFYAYSNHSPVVTIKLFLLMHVVMIDWRMANGLMAIRLTCSCMDSTQGDNF